MAKILEDVNADFFLGDQAVTMRTEKWSEWYIVMGSDQNGVLHGRKGHDVELQGQFSFVRVETDQPFFLIKSKKWTEWFVYMTNTADGRIESTKEPGLDGQWKVTSVGNGKYTLSNRRWPNWFMCMKNDYIGTMIGCKDSPGSAGTMIIKAV